jgi:hypothetical protein
VTGGIDGGKIFVQDFPKKGISVQVSKIISQGGYDQASKGSV